MQYNNRIYFSTMIKNYSQSNKSIRSIMHCVVGECFFQNKDECAIPQKKIKIMQYFQNNFVWKCIIIIDMIPIMHSSSTSSQHSTKLIEKKNSGAIYHQTSTSIITSNIIQSNPRQSKKNLHTKVIPLSVHSSCPCTFKRFFCKYVHSSLMFSCRHACITCHHPHEHHHRHQHWLAAAATLGNPFFRNTLRLLVGMLKK